VFSLPFHVAVLAAGLISAAHILMVGPTAASLGLPLWTALPLLYLGSATSRLSASRPYSRLLAALKLASPLVTFGAILYGTTWATWALSLVDFSPVHTGTIGLAMAPLFAPLFLAHLAICTEPSASVLLPVGNPLDSSWRVRIPLSMWTLLLLLLAIGDLSSATPELQAYLLASPIGQAIQLLSALGLAGMAAPRALLWGMDLVPLEGHLRRRAEAMTEAVGLKNVRVFEWRTDREITNAMVIGVPPGSYCVVFSDRILEQLGTDEFDAVLAHELGHIRGRHVRHFLVWILAVLALTVAADTGSPTESSSLSWVLSLGSIVALLMWIRFVSRRFELEADLYASESKPDGLTRALLGLGQGFDSHFKNGFRHFSMSRRILFVRGVKSDSGVGERLVRVTNRIRKSGLVFLGVAVITLTGVSYHLALRTEVILSVQRGDFGGALELLGDLDADHRGELNETFPSLEPLLAEGAKTFGGHQVVTSEVLAEHSYLALANSPTLDILPDVITWLDLAILRSFGNAPGERDLRRALVLAAAGDGESKNRLDSLTRLPELEQPWRDVARVVLDRIKSMPSGN
jgi:Zn-dependent protease with chaperone function